MDSDGIVTAWNRSAEEIFGWPAHKAIGKSLAELIVPERYRAAHERGLQRFLETGKGPLLDKHVELLAVHRDGHEFPVELSVTAVKVRGGFMFHAIPARHHRPQAPRARDPAAHRAAAGHGRGTGLVYAGASTAPACGASDPSRGTAPVVVASSTSPPGIERRSSGTLIATRRSPRRYETTPGMSSTASNGAGRVRRRAIRSR